MGLEPGQHAQKRGLAVRKYPAGRRTAFIDGQRQVVDGGEVAEARLVTLSNLDIGLRLVDRSTARNPGRCCPVVWLLASPAARQTVFRKRRDLQIRLTLSVVLTHVVVPKPVPTSGDMLEWPSGTLRSCSGTVLTERKKAPAEPGFNYRPVTTLVHVRVKGAASWNRVAC